MMMVGTTYSFPDDTAATTTGPRQDDSAFADMPIMIGKGHRFFASAMNSPAIVADLGYSPERRGHGDVAGFWEGTDGILAAAVDEQSRTALGTYRHEPRRVGQDANIERSIAEGAYAKRQLFELVQNAADAMRDAAGRCEVVLTSDTLYVANSGEPFGVDGVIALMGTHDSVKRDDQIGRFGLGFKSLLAVTDSPRIFSRSGSFIFDREESRRQIGRIVPGQDNYPVMRWARAVDPSDARHDDVVLDGLMKWATTVVVAPLKRDRALIAHGLRTFPA